MFGGGSFGTAIGCALARQKPDLAVMLLLRDPQVPPAPATSTALQAMVFIAQTACVPFPQYGQSIKSVPTRGLRRADVTCVCVGAAPCREFCKDLL